MENEFLIFAFGAICGVLVCGVVILLVAIFAPDKEEKPEEQESDKLERLLEKIADTLKEREPEDDWDTAEVEESDEDPRVLLVANIRRLTEQGFSQREIGRALGMSQKSVWRIMKRYGIKKA